MSHYRVEVYRPADTSPGLVVPHHYYPRTRAAVAQRVATELRGAPVGSFALVIEVGAFARDEDVLERWRVAPDGRLLRSRYSVTDTEHEVAR